MNLQNSLSKQSCLRIVYSWFFIFLLISCQKSDKQPDSSADTLILSEKIETTEIIDCRSLVKDVNFELSREGLIEYYGKENHDDDTLYAEGEMTGFASVLWKGSPKEIQIIWQDDQMAKAIGFSINNTNSNRRLLDKFYVGMTLNELVQVNGAPVELSGFGWDYGGGCCFGDKKGLLAQINCLSFRFDLDNVAYEQTNVDQVLGDQIFSSEHPFFQQNKAILMNINVYFD
ncbi:MAG: hypothetical protein SNJ77_03755 [Cytophagales bacterium]